MRRKRHQFTSDIDGYEVLVTYEADTRKNGEVYIRGLDVKTYGDTWLEAISNARQRIRAEGETGKLKTRPNTQLQARYAADIDIDRYRAKHFQTPALTEREGDIRGGMVIARYNGFHDGWLAGYKQAMKSFKEKQENDRKSDGGALR